MSNSYGIECEECGAISIVETYEMPEFCPVCGRRVEAEENKLDVDYSGDD